MAKKLEVGKDITQEELDRLKLIKTFTTIEPDSLSFRIMLGADALLLQMRQVMFQAEKRVLNVAQSVDRIRRLKAELASGIIKETIRDNLTMNEDEVRTEIRHHEYIAKTEAYDALHQLSRLRAYVGRLKLDKTVVLTEEDYNAFSQRVLDDLRGMGYDVLA